MQTNKHTQPSPFPMTLPNGDKVIDERCACGKLRSEHSDTFSYGHGASFDGECVRYTWASFVRVGD